MQPCRCNCCCENMGGSWGSGLQLWAWPSVADALTVGAAASSTVAHPGRPSNPKSPGTPPPPRLQVQLYTFGAPRPGNHAFWREFIKTVPDSWDTVHANDAVAKEGGCALALLPSPGVLRILLLC